MPTDPPSQEAFDKFLAWLDPDREKAGVRYEQIRDRLKNLFSSRGCFDPDGLTDITIDRVLAKIDWLVANYVGNPQLFFFGVAKNVLKEEIRHRPQMTSQDPIPVAVAESSDDSRMFECLDVCMEELPQQGSLLRRYYHGEGKAKIVNRNKIANELGITLRALRLRVYHLRLHLRSCMEHCLAESPT